MNNTIYVGNLSRVTTEATLKAMFEPYGYVTSVKIIIDKMTGEPRGFAFVDMETEQASQDAITALNGKEVDGQRLRINAARPREQRPMNRERSFGGPRGENRGGFRQGGFRSNNDDRGGFRSRY
jgi:RNA recognition motif-containing protein